jgi:hypothetical protein
VTTVTILADNGVSSGTSGLKTSGGNDGTLALQSTNSAGTALTGLTIDNNQNVSLPNSLSSVNTFGFKNRIINGGITIDQRNSGASSTPSSSNTYSVDRFYSGFTQSSKFTFQQTPSATETGYATRLGAGFRNYLACTTASAVSVGSGDFFFITQAIEGYNIADLMWGTSSAKTATVSFWAYSSLTGTFNVNISNSDYTRGYASTYTISAANTWQYVTMTIPGDTSGTWLTTTGVGLRVMWNLGTGSGGSQTVGAWGAWAGTGASGAVSVVGTAGATFYVTGVQFERGTQATSFDFRSYGTELALCQRYHQGGANTSASVEAGPNCVVFLSPVTVSVGSTARAQLPMKVTMRAAPSLQTSNNSQFGKGYFNGAGATIAIFSVNNESCSAVGTSVGTGGLDLNFYYALDAEL